MEKRNVRSVLPYVSCIFGIIAYVFEDRMFSKHVDSTGLVIAGSGYRIVLWSVLLLAIVVILAITKYMQLDNREEISFAILFQAIAIVLSGYHAYTTQKDVMAIIMMGLASAAATLCVVRVKFKQVAFVSHLFTAVYLALHIVLRYRASSADPQLVDYVFPLLAEISLMLFAYNLAAKEVGADNFKKRILWQSIAILFCCTAIRGGEYEYILFLLWLLPSQYKKSID